jgi:hypothetical protein
MAIWKIVNINAVVYFDITIKIDQLAELISKDFPINYRPEDFAGLVVYYDKFKINIFKTGAIIISGIKKLEDLTSIIEDVKKILKKYIKNLPEKYTLKIANIVISGKFDYNKVDIEKMSSELEDAFYDPARFWAATVYYNISPKDKVTFNVFKNGSFVATGLKPDLTSVNQYINKVVNSFQEEVIKKFVK